VEQIEINREILSCIKKQRQNDEVALVQLLAESLQAAKDYDRAYTAKRIELREQGVTSSDCDKIIDGMDGIAELKYNKLKLDGMFKLATKANEHLSDHISGLQSIGRYQSEV